MGSCSCLESSTITQFHHSNINVSESILFNGYIIIQNRNIKHKTEKEKKRNHVSSCILSDSTHSLSSREGKGKYNKFCWNQLNRPKFRTVSWQFSMHIACKRHIKMHAKVWRQTITHTCKLWNNYISSNFSKCCFEHT